MPILNSQTKKNKSQGNAFEIKAIYHSSFTVHITKFQGLDENPHQRKLSSSRSYVYGNHISTGPIVTPSEMI